MRRSYMENCPELTTHDLKIWRHFSCSYMLSSQTARAPTVTVCSGRNQCGAKQAIAYVSYPAVYMIWIRGKGSAFCQAFIICHSSDFHFSFLIFNSHLETMKILIMVLNNA